MRKIFTVILVLAATAALNSCVVDRGGNQNLNAYQLQQYSRYLVEYSSLVSVSAINQMVLDGRDINAEGFTGKAADGILFTRVEQDRWEVTGLNDVTSYSLTLLREPAADGYDKWICQDVQSLHDEGADGCIKLRSDGDIVFEWVTHIYTVSMSSSLEQTGSYRVEFFTDSHAASCTDWCVLNYTAGNVEWTTSRGGKGRDIYYE